MFVLSRVLRAVKFFEPVFLMTSNHRILDGYNANHHLFRLHVPFSCGFFRVNLRISVQLVNIGDRYRQLSFTRLHIFIERLFCAQCVMSLFSAAVGITDEIASHLIS